MCKPKLFPLHHFTKHNPLIQYVNLKKDDTYEEELLGSNLKRASQAFSFRSSQAAHFRENSELNCLPLALNCLPVLCSCCLSQPL